ncbi:MAG: response regulator transcription factor [Planctomycetes bacterium]|nr:response regulator transcription factor [Planctomycetota bacterium]
MSKQQILIVEDEQEIAALIALQLERHGYTPIQAHDGKATFERLTELVPDLILLDLMLPDISGLDICKKLKEDDATKNIPIIIVSALSEESDVVIGLELGASDYVPKPFSTKILLARIRAVLRREAQPESTNNKMSIGEIIMDENRHEVLCKGVPLQLTPTEYGILFFLMSRPGFVRTRDQITQSLHGHSASLVGRTIDVHVNSLRRKLGECADMIETVRGVGYRIVKPHSEEPRG